MNRSMCPKGVAQSAHFTPVLRSTVVSRCIPILAILMVNSEGIFNTYRPGYDSRRFAGDIYKYIFLNENNYTLIRFPVVFVSKDTINIQSALFQVMGWCRNGKSYTWRNVHHNLRRRMASLLDNDKTLELLDNLKWLVSSKVQLIVNIYTHMWTLVPEAGVSGRDR